MDGKKISKAAHDNEVEENRKENKKEIAVDSCLIDGDVRREEAPSRMTGQLEGDPKEVNFADDGSLRLENEHLDNEMLKIEKSKQPKFSQSEDAKKKHEVVRIRMNYLLPKFHTPLLRFSPNLQMFRHYTQKMEVLRNLAAKG